MITPDMIAAETPTPALTEVQKLNILMLVRAAYPNYVGMFDAALESGIDVEMATPSVRTQALKAVLTQLNVIPEFVVEAQGDVNSPSFFSTVQNWRALALDVLNVFRIRLVESHQSFGVVTPSIEDLTFDDNSVINPVTPLLKL